LRVAATYALAVAGVSVLLWVLFAMATPNNPPDLEETLAIVLFSAIAVSAVLALLKSRTPRGPDDKPR